MSNTEQITEKIEGEDLSKDMDEICENLDGESDIVVFNGEEMDICILREKDTAIIENGMVVPFKG